jgi:hypothetical protein
MAPVLRPWLLASVVVITAAHSQLASPGAPLRQAEPPASAQAEYMRAHFNQAMVVHAAVIRGDLAAVAPAARVLADQDPASLPAGSAAHVDAMKQAARLATEAADILAAGQATARMLTPVATATGLPARCRHCDAVASPGRRHRGTCSSTSWPWTRCCRLVVPSDSSGVRHTGDGDRTDASARATRRFGRAP